jgi:hypothetical protein
VATETGPDLEFGRQAVEALMDDSCDVYLPNAPHKQAMDPGTLALTPTGGLRGAKVYADGRCKVKDATSNSRGGPVHAEGSQQLAVTASQIDFPLGDVPASGFPVGSVVVMRSSRRNPFLVGNEYVIREQVEKTMAIKYGVLADKRKNVDP